MIVAEVDEHAAKVFAILHGRTGAFNKGGMDGLLAIGSGVYKVDVLCDCQLGIRNVENLTANPLNNVCVGESSSSFGAKL